MNIEQLAANYKINEAGIDVVRASRTCFVVGIVAAGKDTIVNELLDYSDYHRIISHTTRRPRANNGVMEVDGIDYHFVSFDQMAQLLSDHKMVEVNNFGGNYYGISVAEIDDANANSKIAISDIDVHGIMAFSAIAPDNTTAIFIIPPDFETWANRLNNRYESTDDIAAVWQNRRSIAIDELEHALNSPIYHFIINDDLDAAVQQANSIAHNQTDGNYADARIKATEILSAIKRSA